MNKTYLRFLLGQRVVKIGRFTLKSGRESPYFITTGEINDGASIKKMGEFYAETIIDRVGGEFDVVWGPAYKAIPLSVAITVALHDKYGINKGWTFDRKEVKTYGDASSYVGMPVKGKKVVMVDDVLTTGGTKVEAVKKIRNLGGEVVAVVIAIDREEIGEKKKATEEFTDKTGIPVYAVETISNLFELIKHQIEPETYQMFLDYRKKYGVVNE